MKVFLFIFLFYCSEICAKNSITIAIDENIFVPVAMIAQKYSRQYNIILNLKEQQTDYNVDVLITYKQSAIDTFKKKNHSYHIKNHFLQDKMSLFINNNNMECDQILGDLSKFLEKKNIIISAASIDLSKNIIENIGNKFNDKLITPRYNVDSIALISKGTKNVGILPRSSRSFAQTINICDLPATEHFYSIISRKNGIDFMNFVVDNSDYFEEFIVVRSEE